ncbi:hypothetical protein Dip510_000068 [Elusimicrobium posterum]|uniref:gp53-like domain-containing protein n=1 Tax=Elusimicrobium posterum TaxID=3116653 RepID=UPI003C747A0B
MTKRISDLQNKSDGLQDSNNFAIDTGVQSFRLSAAQLWDFVKQKMLHSCSSISLDNLSAAGQEKFDKKADIDLGNLSTQGNIKFITPVVIVSPTNGEAWYRRWLDEKGNTILIEQWGYNTNAEIGNNSASLENNFPIPFSKILSFIAIGCTIGSDTKSASTGGDTTTNVSNTAYGVKFRDNYGKSYRWYAVGN